MPESREVLSRLLGPFVDRGKGGAELPTYTLRDRGADVARRYALHLDDSKIQEVVSAGSMLDWLIAHFCQQAIDTTEEFLALHAGVVASDGVSAIFPAPPDAGKTTLTAGLTRAGLGFLSDEIAAIDTDTALVHPFPRPILMDAATMDVLDGLREELPPAYEAFRRGRYHVAPDDLRPGSLGTACEIGFVIAPAYRPGSSTTLQPMSRAETLMHLADTSFNLDRMGRAGFEALVQVARSGRGYRLSIGDLESAIAIVTDLLGSRRP